jgi:hypothetical protein
VSQKFGSFQLKAVRTFSSQTRKRMKPCGRVTHKVVLLTHFSSYKKHTKKETSKDGFFLFPNVINVGD